MKAKVRKIVAWSVVALLPIVVLWITIVVRPADKYQFLKPGQLVWRAYTRGGSHSAKEIRSYTWKQPWKEVAGAAAVELERLGFKNATRAKFAARSIGWKLNEASEGRPSFEGTDFDVAIRVYPGRSSPRTANSVTDMNPEWVTVIISERAEETWLHTIRTMLFGIE